ncbi:MAG: DUF1616 domain-containing protein [Candidatus Moranbacteria bacterium]|nr:DUF1616 domain-containing protein [Candidatus Moranbacteria bacterium]
MEIILDIIKLNFALFFLLFLPGYLLLKTIFPDGRTFSFVGEAVVSFALSIAIVNLLTMLLDRMGIPLNSLTVFTSFAVFAFLAGASALARRKGLPKKGGDQSSIATGKGWLAFFAVIGLSIFARMVYLIPKVIPHTTDSGHHMYWVKYITDFSHLPQYGIPDVIIGEHIIFAAVSLLSGVSVVSSLPVIVLFLINFFSLLAVFLLARQISLSWTSKKNSFLIGLLALAALGVFYAISSPQGKYINGGVVGNMLGGLFIPLSLYLFAKALNEKKQLLSALGVLMIGIMAYTHHLSTFVFLYVFAAIAICFAFYLALARLSNQASNGEIMKKLKVLVNFKSVAVGIGLIIFVYLIRVPSYLNPSAINTAVGEPSKSTRTGMEFTEVLLSTGPWRVFYSVAGSLLLATVIVAGAKKSSYLKSFLTKFYSLRRETGLNAGLLACVALLWFWMIFLMSSFPDVFKIDIPSGRIVNYLTYPSALLAAFGAFAILKPVISRIPARIGILFFALILSTGLISGSSDVSEFYPVEAEKEQTMWIETFRGSRYLADKTKEEEVILKDHVYLPADSWVKVFLMRGYEKPLSRALLKRYDDPVKDRETCTRDMISIPDSSIGKECYQQTSVEYIILRNGYDTTQFEKSPHFSKIYSSEHVVIFQRPTFNQSL